MIDNKLKFGLGCLPSPYDPRDYTIDKFNIASSSILPDEYTITYVPDVQNQGSSSMCVAFALSGIKQSHEWKERGVKKRYSPAFIYANREITDWQGEGMIPRQSLKRLKYGTCEFDDFNTIGTYQECKNILNQRTNELVPLALSQKIYAYARLTKVQDIKQCLYEFNMPLLVTIDIYDSFCNTGSNGIVSAPSGNNLGGHAMLIFGYCKINGIEYFKILNSWGTSWSNNGMCYMNFNTYNFKECWAVLDQKPEQEIERPIEILLTIGNKNMVVDNNIIELPIAPFYKDSTTCVPIRAISEAFKCTVQWIDANPTGENGDMILITNGGERTLEELKQLAGRV